MDWWNKTAGTQYIFFLFSMSDSIQCFGVIVLRKRQQVETTVLDVLMVQHRKTNSLHWGFPKGKKKREDCSELDIDTAIRELREETGMSRVELTGQTVDDKYPHKGGEKKVKYWIGFVATDSDEETRRERVCLNTLKRPEEICGIGWFRLDRLESVLLKIRGYGDRDDRDRFVHGGTLALAEKVLAMFATVRATSFAEVSIDRALCLPCLTSAPGRC